MFVFGWRINYWNHFGYVVDNFNGEYLGVGLQSRALAPAPFKYDANHIKSLMHICISVLG